GLRTTFGNVGGRGVRIIRTAERLMLPVVDLSGLTGRELEGELGRQAVEEGNLAFDFEQGPLVRMKVVRLGSEGHVLLFTVHHVVSDGWSISILTREVSALYEANCEGWPSELAELLIQYADYASWQREWMSGEVLDRQLNYWRTALGGARPGLDLATDYARPTAQSYVGARVPIDLNERLSAEIHEFSQREGTTLFMSLLTALQVLLCRYVGESDIVVGTTIANRTRVETEGIIGFFINTLVLRTRWTGEPSWRELVLRVKEVVLEAYANQDFPFEKLVEE
ncbi:MAG: condensation domain-containing protein, partial [Blastocatellia bacterium]